MFFQFGFWSVFLFFLNFDWCLSLLWLHNDHIQLCILKLKYLKYVIFLQYVAVHYKDKFHFKNNWRLLTTEYETSLSQRIYKHKPFLYRFIMQRVADYILQLTLNIFVPIYFCLSPPNLCLPSILHISVLCLCSSFVVRAFQHVDPANVCHLHQATKCVFTTQPVNVLWITVKYLD